MIDKRLVRIGKQATARLTRDHKYGQKRITLLFQKMRKHPGSYKPGFKPSAAKVPKGITKQAAGIFGLLTKKSAALSKLYGVAKQKISGHLRKHGVDIAKDIGKAAASVIVQRLKRKVDSHADSYKKRSGAHLDTVGKRVDKFIGQYLTGSGVKRAAVKLFKK